MNIVARSKWRLLFCLTLFLVGILCGVVFSKPYVIYRFYMQRCEDYISKIFDTDYSVWKIFFGRLFSCMAVYGACLLLALFPCGFLPSFLLAFCKGYTFVGWIQCLFPIYGFNGAIVFVVIVLPQTLLFTAALCYAVVFCKCVSACEMTLQKYLLVGAALILLAALLEFLVVAVFYRLLCLI